MPLISRTLILEASSWLDPEILTLSEETIRKYFEEEPELANYTRFVYQITRKREHILDAKMEALLSRAGEMGNAPSNIYSMFNNADIVFPDVEDGEGNRYPLTQGNYIFYLESKDRVLRKNAFETLYSVYRQYRNSIAATFYANAKQADFFAQTTIFLYFLQF